MDIRPLDDVMNHFQWIFFTYIILLLVICSNLVKCILNKKINFNSIIDVVINILCWIAMIAGYMFFMVLSDNYAIGWKNWYNTLRIISNTSIIIIIINISIILKKRNKNLFNNRCS